MESEAAARAVVDQARTEQWQANHHCSAFVIGADGSPHRSSDDGEPAGTAGRPMLEVLTHAGVTDVVAVVTRYFGGTKLGTGGLARAYSGAVALALDKAPRVRRNLMRVCVLSISHADAGRVEHALRGDGIAVLDVAYDTAVLLTVAVPDGEESALRSRLGALGVGDDALRVGETRWHDVPPP
ncbi:IMPACT family protein [Solicola gregarius]|uniref:IMPACT family protein n=1 Tax=Solicola gregarius TaxID=2908642 RepID=A0AA46TF36_9ACTN|nr:IMPACT family protein [Solicola gregarius]